MKNVEKPMGNKHYLFITKIHYFTSSSLFWIYDSSLNFILKVLFYT